MKAEQIFEGNERLIEEFVDDYKVIKNLSHKRVYKYKLFLGKLNEWIDKPLSDLTKKEFIDIKRRLQESEMSGESKNDFIKMLRTFNRNKELKWDLEWMKPNFKCKELLASDILTEEEISRWVRAGRTTKERAFLMTLYETGARSQEIRSIKLKHVQINGINALVTIPQSKTKTRSLPLRASMPYLKDWLNEHPDANDKEAYLFCNGSPFNSLTDRYWLDVVKECASRAGIKKPVWLHLIRHSRATHLVSQGMNDLMLRKWMGWSNGSRVPGRYTHLSTEDLAEWSNGEKKPMARDEHIRAVSCHRCGTENKPTNNICSNCFVAITDEEAVKQQEKFDLLYELMKTPQFQEIANKFLTMRGNKMDT